MTLPYCPHRPTATQTAFLLTDDLGYLEVLYGGAAGGGKSDALLMAALRYVSIPGYAALLLRRTFADLSLPGALMDRAHEWLGPSNARWEQQTKTWHFPEGSRLSFGYLETANDHYRYQSAEFQYIGFDELTQFQEHQYRYMFSRLRRLTGSPVPLRMRPASNPGGLGHEWVKSRFIDTRDPTRLFVPAKLADNPYVDREGYDRALAQLHPIDQARLRDGDWEANYEGGFFKREWFSIVDASPVKARRVRYWDKAATAGGGDWSVGCKIAKANDGTFTIEDVIRGQWSSGEREKIIRQTAEIDGRDVLIHLEQEPGSGGKDSASATVRNLAGFAAYADPVTGDKQARAKPLAAQAYAGNVAILRGAWNLAFLDELTGFPVAAHDDQVDAASGAFNRLNDYYSAGAF